MDAILSSFCFTKEALAGDNNYFHRLPPVCFKTWNQFVPDYSVLFLCDRFYADAHAIERIEREPLFKKHKEMLGALKSCGRLEVRDFKSEVAPYASAIHAHVETRTRNLNDWSATFEQVVGKWDGFYDRVVENYQDAWTAEEEQLLREAGDDIDAEEVYLERHHEWPEERLMLASMEGGMYEGLERGLLETLSRWDEDIPEYHRERATGVISSYVEHVAASLCLSDVLGATLHDWEDIGPVYNAVLTDTLRVSSAKELERQKQINNLIEVMFPDFEPKSEIALARALDDPRITELRSLVENAVEHDVVFDTDFANQTLRDVLNAGKKIDKARRLTGWISKPLGFIPYAGFLVEGFTNTAVEKLVEKKAKKGLSWFYLLSEINA
ncbi:hypothetical protein [Rhodopirellula sp. SWK7]|uniref:hypothetical protein n=1 Tax=Rhodopirellula sp. SWK7 TaxID=595460 RepID=UPI0002BF4844|nr:hypothetical protein [Rhodopirellula sp. SWK7]EMI44542.1 hypothetical protein RRSWK_03046 [Rhodopirellula sp. SWK7]